MAESVKVQVLSKRTVIFEERKRIGIPPVVRYDQRKVRRNIERNAELLAKGKAVQLERAGQLKSRPEPAVIVGHGAWNELPPGVIFASGVEAGEALNAIGIVPAYCLVMNPDERRLPQAQVYILANQCDPALFRQCPSGPGALPPLVFAVLPEVPHEDNIALYVAATMGFYDLHVVGIDASAQYHGPNVVSVQCDGKVFRCPSNWRDCYAFVRGAHKMVDIGYDVTFHGHGLLQEAIRAINREPSQPPDEVSYDLSNAAASFDFVNFIATARLYVGRHTQIKVRLVGTAADKTDIMTQPQRQQMIDKVIRPAMAMFNAIEDNTIKQDRSYTCAYLPMVEAARAGKPIYKIRLGSTLRNPKKIVITLREAPYMPMRDSNVEAWKEFARRRIGEGWDALFIRDTAKADEPLDGFATDPDASRDLRARVLRYEEATCNMSVATGPVSLMYFSDNPFIVFNPIGHVPGYAPLHPDWWRVTCGMEPGEQFPWFNPDQVLDWNHDTLENIEAAWAKWAAHKYFDEMLAA